MDDTLVTPTAEAMRALSHPERLLVLGALRAEGPGTASTLSVRLGINTGATSYHLRMLARHGFVVEDKTMGDRRDRWWRAVDRWDLRDWVVRLTPARARALLEAMAALADEVEPDEGAEATEFQVQLQCLPLPSL